jgi:hypothetical protein
MAARTTPQSASGAIAFVIRVGGWLVRAARIALCLVLAVPAIGTAGPAVPAAAATNPIVTENQLPGSTGWLWGALISDDLNGQIKGFASATSVMQGDSITLYVTTNPPQPYTIDIYRLGWYGGAGGRFLQHIATDGFTQDQCVPDATTGLAMCWWAPSATVTVPTSWTSGVYLAKLQNENGYQNYIIFVVRDGRPAAFLYQQAITTDQAYNNYPCDDSRPSLCTGKSLYTFNSHGANTISGDARAVKVSFDRPYSGYGFRDFDQFDAIHWLERSGYDVTYSTDLDTHLNGADLLRHRAFLSVGHDEYWSKEMFDAALAARDAGVNLAFLAANAAYWQVRFEQSDANVPNRVMVCFKDATLDPGWGANTTVNFRDPPVNRPEQTLIGVQYTSYSADGEAGSNSPFVVTNSTNWAYAGTGLHDGDSVPGIVGYEIDRFYTNLPAPTNRTRTLLSDSPFVDRLGMSDRSNASIYQAPSGAWVFATGTISWVWGLDDFIHSQADARIQRVTANVLDAFLNGAPVVDHLVVAAPANVTAGRPFAVNVTAVDSRGQTFAAYSGRVHFASSDTAPNVALPADSDLPGGQGSFNVTLGTSGSQTVTVSDAANSLSTTVTIPVSAGTAGFALATAATPVAGTAFTFTVTAKDASGSTDPTYAGRVHFTTTDAGTGVALPADATLAGGQGTFSATLIHAGVQTVTATDTVNPSIAGTLSVAVRAASATQLRLATAAAPTAGTAFTFTATALDQYGNTDQSYAGTVHFTSTDTSAGRVLPADARLTAGQGTFSATLVKAGPQRITAVDTVTASIKGSVAVTISPAAAASITVQTPAAVGAGQSFQFTATAKDRYGNVATGYTGTVHFTSSDGSLFVNLPANYRFTAGDAGTHTFSATLWSPGDQTITVTDTVNGGVRGTSPPVRVGL